MDDSSQSPVAINAHKKTNVSYERRIPSGILAEMIKVFKGCKIQSTISNSAQYDSDKQVDAINDSDEQVDDDNDSNEQVNDINYYQELVDARSDPTSNPSRNPKVATHTTNGISATHTTNGI